MNNERGFTLIEMILAIVVLGVLAAVATVQFGTVVQDSRDATVQAVAGTTSAQLALAINSLKALPTGGAGGTFDTNVRGAMTATGKVSISVYDGANNRFAVCTLSGAGPCTIGGTLAAPTAATCGSTNDRFIQVAYTPATGALAFLGPQFCAS